MSRSITNSLGTLFIALALPVVAAEQEIRDSVALGVLVFAENCKQCHQIDGYGEEALYPSLRDEKLLANKTMLIKTVLNGRLAHEQEGADAKPLMPSMNFLSNREIAAIIAFITNTWGDQVLIVTEEEVQNARQ